MSDLLEIVKIGGPAVSTAVVFVWYLDRLDKRNTDLVGNHMKHVTDAINNNSKVLSKLSILISRFIKYERHR